VSTKVVKTTITVTFEGDYYEVSEVEDKVCDWIDAGLCDRDDVVGWSFGESSVTETE
jgi:hypothetical protein